MQVHSKKLHFILMTLVTFFLFACSIATTSELQQGKRDIEMGYYKQAMLELLGPACEGVPEAQYAVGYMYYYGYGVVQDIDVGYFWIKRAARKGYAPAFVAIQLIEKLEHEKRMVGMQKNVAGAK